MSALVRVILVMLFVCLPSSQYAGAQDGPREHYEAAVKATRLDAEGKAPFHLRIDAKIYDLAGKAPQSATIEEWWASPYQRRIELKGAGVDTVESSAQPSLPTTYNREQYLLESLLMQVVHPLVLPARTQNLEFTTVERTIAGVQLHCLVVRTQVGSTTDSMPPSYCLGSTQELRLVSEGSELIVRNRIGKFHDTEVGLGVALGFDGRPAADGSVVALQDFDPSQSKLPEFGTTASAAPSDAAPTFQPPLIMRGKKIGGSVPTYPMEAKREHIHGTVVLCALINTEGKISSLDVVASSSDVLTRAAKDAIKTWTYTPYEIDGKAVPVTTTVTVHFNIG